ncbi:MAG: hypothetical protein JL50_02870 [Peptococcaceae bacterium BICA1-7]|nr:MAG: hypothetical protein JL50_02870 [Peptococcaceae bacterium BICA1-7]HBV97793.1 hypothetical protein [Desulfotomaculum sp.]
MSKIKNLNDNAVFNAMMLIIARESRGLTQKELSEKIGVTQGWLSRVEGGLRSISDDVLDKISSILDYPIGFFYQTERIYGLGASELFNRKRQDIPVKKLNTIYSQINIRIIHLSRMLRGVDIGEVNFPHFELADFNGNIGNITQAVRAMWHIPQGPINNLTEVIENNGGIVIPFDFGTTRIDATSFCIPGLPPLFFVNINIPGDRLRFTLCHELGHTIMHQRDLNPDMERQADTFAANFLMPEKEIRPYLRDLSLSRLAELKLYWKVSMASMLTTASNIGTITPEESKLLWKKMSIRGYRTHEPLEYDIPVEIPTLYQEIIDVYRNEMGYSSSELSDMLNLNEHEARHMYFNSRRQLRVIK